MSYHITRLYFRDYPPARIIKRGLTLEQAQAHCKNPETSSSTATSAAARKRTRRFGKWFDSYSETK